MKSIGHIVLRSLYVLLFSLAIEPALMAQLHTDFTASPASGCAPVFVHFTDNSTGNPDSWKWDLGNGTISFLQNPSTTYFNPGKYTIKLVIKKANLTDSLVKVGFITVNALPKPLFKASDTTGCYPLKIDFTDLSSPQEGNIVKWEWDLGDGSASTLQNPTHVYTGPGNYNVILRVTNTAGCVSTVSKAQYIKIKDGVQAAYSFTGSSQCTPPAVIHFTNNSTGTGILSYQWLFGDGNSSAAQHPSNTYNTAGLYTIQLIVKNNTGCTDTLTKKDSIAVGVAHADFTAPDSVCQNSSVQLHNTSQPATGKLLWNFGNGNSSVAANPTVTYSNAGVFNISLVADFGSCKDSVTRPIKVIAAPKADFTADKTASCSAPFTVQFSNTGSGAVSYQWLFGDSTGSVLENPSHTYTKTGSYHITLIVTNSSGCTDTLTKKTYISVLPADIQIKNIPASGCAPLLFTPVYTVKSVLPVVSYVWDFGDGSTSAAPIPSHTYTNPGVYTLTVTYTTSDGCTGTVSYPNAVMAGKKPVAAFSASPNNTCASTPVVFTDNSAGNITSWLWSFGDGLTDTARNPVHLYQDTGYFNIKLVVSNNGCTDTLVKPSLVYIKPPIAKFAADVKCNDPFRISFTNYSIGASSWNWDFGDGNSSVVKDPVHVYGNTGNYLVKLTVVNGGCTHVTAYRARIIKEKANFSAADTVVCRGDTVRLQSFGFNQSNIVSYKWLPYNGTDTASAMKVVYNKSGQYTVSLAITNSNGCTDTLVKTNYITVNGPVADFNGVSNSACLKAGGSIAFADSSSTDGTHAIKKWNWNFGDGSTQSYTTAPFSHNYAAAGYYTVGLTVTDTEGCADSISKTNQIYIANPVAVFSSVDTMSCKNKPVSFTSQSQGQSLRYDWGFGDATGSVQQDPIHNFANIGVYDAWLKITDAYGCTDSLFKPAYIHIDEPKALFLMSDSASTCPPLVVNFSNQSKYYQLLNWDFGDGTGSLVKDPVHYYNYPGTYYAKLVVTSPGGCTDTLSRKIVIKGPTGSFTYDKTVSCNPGNIGFAAQTQNTQSIIWDFNDGGTLQTADSNTKHSYTALGIYVPKMILEDAKGCKVPIAGKDTIRIYGVTAMFGSDTRLLCDQGTVNFNDASLSNDLITSYQWVLGDGSVSADKDPVHSYTATGIYPVKLLVTTANGCTDSTGTATNIKVVGSPRVSLRGDSAACVPAILQFTGNIDVADTSAFSWQWQFSNNTASTVQNPAPVSFQQDGIFSASMTVTNSSGCTTTKVKPVIIHPLPQVNAGDNTIICEKKAATLEATGADKYTWSPAAGLSCANCATPVASPDSTITYRVNGESIFGCKGADSVIISVKHPFRMQVERGDTLCKGESFRLQAKNAEMYEWLPATGLDDSHSRTPMARPDQTTDYQAIGKDAQGCFYDTGFVKITVYPYPVVDAGADKTISVGSSVQLDTKISKDATVIRWQPSTGLSCANCANPVANPKQTTSYRVIALNEGGCITKDELTIFVVCNNGNIFLPNTFSPNGNGTNDVFYPRGTGLYNIKSMRIFNRWGEQVFEATNFKANDASRGWRGLYKDKPAPNDVYVYFVEVICENNAVLTYSGNIALIR